MKKMSEQLSVAKDIKALALINIQDIFWFTITATDEEIEDRYGSEARAIEVAEKYLEIAMRTSVLEYDLKGWSVTYSVPIKDKNERIEKTAYFYDKADCKTENSSEKPNNCEHITEDGVTCAKYPACDDCLDNPLNKVKGSERLVKGSEQTEPTISKMEQVDKDINVRSKTEPQTEEWHDDCNTCRWHDGACTIPCCDYEPKTGPQTDCSWK